MRAKVLAFAAAERAAQSPDIAMDFEQASGTGTIVEAIDILGDEGEIGRAFLQLCEGPVSGVRLGFRDQAASPVIPFPDELGIAGEGLRSRKFFRAEVLPESAEVAERWNTAFGRDSGAGEDGDGAGGRDPGADGRQHF